ncbi:MAG: hypothetical protein ABIV51_08070 [Saprospiraceae bacterium]
MANNTSPHILNTSANLLGFCLFVITSLHIANQAEVSKLDEITSLIALFLSVACLFSFLSIRTNNLTREKRLERIADYIFMIALSGILVVIFLITLHFI